MIEFGGVPWKGTTLAFERLGFGAGSVVNPCLPMLQTPIFQNERLGLPKVLFSCNYSFRRYFKVNKMGTLLSPAYKPFNLIQQV